MLKILLTNNNDYIKYKVLERLFSEGYNPNLELVNKEGKTALIVASELNLVDIVTLLLKNKAKPNMSAKLHEEYMNELLIILDRLDEPLIPGKFDLLNYVLEVSKKYDKENDKTMKRIINTLNKEKEDYDALVKTIQKKMDGKRSKKGSKKRSKKRSKKIKN